MCGPIFGPSQTQSENGGRIGSGNLRFFALSFLLVLALLLVIEFEDEDENEDEEELLLWPATPCLVRCRAFNRR